MLDEEKESSGTERVRLRTVKVQRSALAAAAFAEIQIANVSDDLSRSGTVTLMK